MIFNDQKIEAVLFDMDGLIFDTEQIYKQAWLDAAKQMGLPLREEYYDGLIGIRLDEAEAKFKADTQSWIKGGHWPAFDFDAYIEKKNHLVQLLFAQGAPFKKGFHQLWERLAKIENLSLGLVSSSHRPSIERNFSGTQYIHQFSVVISGSDIKKPKPDPEGYLLACEKLKLDPSRVLVFEDSHFGVDAAHNAGCKVVLVPDLIPPTEKALSQAYLHLHSLQDAINLFTDG